MLQCLQLSLMFKYKKETVPKMQMFNNDTSKKETCDSVQIIQKPSFVGKTCIFYSPTLFTRDMCIA